MIPSAAVTELGRLRQPWKVWALKVVHDKLLSIRELFIHLIALQCAVSVLQTQIGHKL